MPGSLEAPLARALEFHNAKQSRLANADWLLHLLRSDPDTLAAVAEALRSIPDCACDATPGRIHVHQEQQVKHLADALFGPRESAGGMEP